MEHEPIEVFCDQFVAMSFRSTGLYEQENVVVASPDMQAVIVISLGTIGVSSMDDPNRRALTEVVDSFQIGSATP